MQESRSSRAPASYVHLASPMPSTMVEQSRPSSPENPTVSDSCTPNESFTYDVGWTFPKDFKALRYLYRVSMYMCNAVMPAEGHLVTLLSDHVFVYVSVASLFRSVGHDSLPAISR